MAIDTVEITIDKDGSADFGRTFVIQKMPAFKGMLFQAKMVKLVTHAGVQLDTDDFAELFTTLFKWFAKLAEPLADGEEAAGFAEKLTYSRLFMKVMGNADMVMVEEIMAVLSDYLYYKPDNGAAQMKVNFNSPNCFVSSPMTGWQLLFESLKFNLGFF